MSLSWSLLGDVAENVISFLDPRHLSQMEATGKAVDAKIASRCWGIMLATAERCVVEWTPWLLQTLPKDIGEKHALKELLSLRLHLNAIPRSWSPQIMAVSPSSLRVSPRDSLEDSTSAEAVRNAPLLPPCASVPLALGTTLGEKFSVGLHIQSNATNGCEAVWLGLELIGVHDGGGKVMSVRCSPFTGRCMTKFPGEGYTLVAQAMQPLAADLRDSVEIYVTVSESGDVEFVRVCQASNSIARSGRLAREMLCPPWTSEIFAAIHVKMEDVLAEMTVTTRLPACDLLQDENQPTFEFDAVWTEME